MNARVLIAAFAGAIAYFLLGWLVYGILTPDFYATHSLTQYYNGLEKTPPNFLGIFVSGFAYTLLMAIIFGNWANITTIRNGAIAGATLSLLFTLSVDLGMWSTMNLYGRWIVVVDVLVNAVMGAMIGAVVAAVLGYKKTA
jgi:glycopeptide antibiotics resistance protein